MCVCGMNKDSCSPDDPYFEYDWERGWVETSESNWKGEKTSKCALLPAPTYYRGDRAEGWSPASKDGVLSGIKSDTVY